MKWFWAPIAALALALLVAPIAMAAVPVWGVSVVHVYPHDPGAFTEGLFYRDGYLYESTGLNGQSSVRKVELATGRVLQRRDLGPQFFGEGIVAWNNRLMQLTWRNHVGFVDDLASFR